MLNRKILSLVIFCSFFLILVSGCDKKTQSSADFNDSVVTDVTVVDEDFDEEGTGVLNCTTPAAANDGIDVTLNYFVTYKRGNILELHSVAKITSSDQNNLDIYEKSYQSISDNYKNLKYYDTSIVRDSNTLTYDVTINYDKIDVDALLDIEGEEDNIIDNGKAKLSLWLDLAGKMGTTCEEA